MNKIESILKKLWIIQSVSNKDKSPKLGDGYEEAIRYNPYNPFSYAFLFFVLLGSIILYGISSLQDIENPFKWD